MDRSGIVLEEKQYECIFLGTGMVESLVSAACSYKIKKALNLDLDNSYSSSFKTINLKELLNSQDIFERKSQKKYVFERISLEYEQNNKDKLLTLSKYYNIDLIPKLIFSKSLAVDEMVKANIDRYLDFRAVYEIYTYYKPSNKFVKLPFSKGEMFSASFLSILQKRGLFKLGQTCARLYELDNDIQKDINSTAEFDKEVQIDEQIINFYQENKLASCIVFLEKMKIPEDVVDIFCYAICHFIKNVNIKENNVSCQQLVGRAWRFFKSCGVHSKSPFLYTNYGTGDMTQGFSRISAVNGHIFIINEDISCSEIVQEEQNGEQIFKLKTSLAGPDEYITAKTLVSSMDYSYLLTTPEQVSIEEESLRMIVSGDCTEELEKYEGPLFFSLPPNIQELQNQNPIHILIMNKWSYSCAKDKFLLYFKNSLKYDQQNLENIEGYITKIKQFLIKHLLDLNIIKNKQENIEQPEEVGNVEEQSQFDFVFSYKQIKRKINQTIKNKNLIVLEDDSLEIDFDDVFEQAADKFKYFEFEDRTLFKKEENEMQDYKDDDEFGESQLDKLVATFQDLKKSEQINSQEEEEKQNELINTQDIQNNKEEEQKIDQDDTYNQNKLN